MKNNHILEKVRKFELAKKVQAMGLYPYFREIESGLDTEVIIGGKKILMFGSNSYLGLNTHPEVKKASLDAVEKYGTGCAGSRFLNGTLDIHVQLEEELADFVGKEASLLFSTGFQVNLGTLSGLIGRNEYIIADKYNHASIVDGCRLSFGKTLKYEHNDIDDLGRVLKSIPADKSKLVVTDGIFSMEGDIVALPGIVDAAEKYNASIMLDDAHSIGVLGKNGAGTASHFNLTEKVYLIMGTFSKSLASLGGFIASDKDTIHYLKHHSRELIFSASMPPANVASVSAALHVMKREPERIEKLWQNTKRMLNGTKDLGLNVGRSETPVIPVYVGDSITCFKMCKMLQDEGIFVNPAVPPAVSEGACIIRLSLMATHTNVQIDFALSKIKKVARELKII
ncbi:MAG: pyridoxal phosphate-dependent aminotransferase family protein [bacterium]